MKVIRKYSMLSSRVMNGSTTLTIRTINKSRMMVRKTINATNMIADNLSSLPKRRPYFFNAFCAGGKTFLADYIVQKYIEKKEEIDWKRNISFGIFGIGYLGLYQTVLFGRVLPYAASHFNPRFSKLIQYVLEVGVHAPFVYFPLYYTYKNAVKDGEISFTKTYEQYFCKNMKDDLTKYGSVWGPAHALTFAVIPIHLRVIWGTGVSFGWTMFLSYWNY